MNKKTDPKPERTDTFFMKEVLETALNARIGLIITSLISVILTIAMVVVISKPQRVIVIDGSSGRTYSTMSHEGIAANLINRQVTYYSTTVCEDFLNLNHKDILLSRANVWNLASNELRNHLTPQYIDSSSTEIKRIISENTESYMQWKMHPRITLRNDPYYSTFMTVTRVVKANNATREVKEFNIKIDWGRLNENSDFTNRPHSLVLLNIQILNEGSTELHDQINKIR